MSLNTAPTPGNTAKTVSEWIFVARNLATLPEGESQAMRCLARAQLLANSVSDWLKLSVAWHNDFGDATIARLCLSHAETYLENSKDYEEVEDWLTVAKAWMDLLGDADSAGSILLKAQEYFESADDCLTIAKAWMDLLEDSSSAIDCLQRAAESCKSVNYCLAVMEDWKDIVEDPGSLGIILLKAEEYCNSDYDWSSVLDAWKYFFQDYYNYVRCAMLFAKSRNRSWSLLKEAIYDDFAYDRFVSEQRAFKDFGTLEQPMPKSLPGWEILTESVADSLGIWNDDCISQRQPRAYSRYFTFGLHTAAVVSIRLECSGTFEYPILYLAPGNNPSDKVLAMYSGPQNTLNCDLLPGTYTLEVANPDAESDLFTIEILIGQ